MAAEITPAIQDDGVAPTVTPIADVEMCFRLDHIPPLHSRSNPGSPDGACLQDRPPYHKTRCSIPHNGPLKTDNETSSSASSAKASKPTGVFGKTTDIAVQTSLDQQPHLHHYHGRSSQSMLPTSATNVLLFATLSGTPGSGPSQRPASLHQNFRFTVLDSMSSSIQPLGPGRRGIALGIPSCFGGHEHGSAVGTMILAKPMAHLVVDCTHPTVFFARVDTQLLQAINDTRVQIFDCTLHTTTTTTTTTTTPASPSFSTTSSNSNPDSTGTSAIWDSMDIHTPIDNYQHSPRTTSQSSPSSPSSPSDFSIFSFSHFSPDTRFEPPISVAHQEILRQAQDTVEENPTASRTTTTDTHTAAISSTPTPTQISYIGSDDILTVLLGGSLPGTNTAGNTEACPGQQWLTGTVEEGNLLSSNQPVAHRMCDFLQISVRVYRAMLWKHTRAHSITIPLRLLCGASELGLCNAHGICKNHTSCEPQGDWRSANFPLSQYLSAIADQDMLQYSGSVSARKAPPRALSTYHPTQYTISGSGSCAVIAAVWVSVVGVLLAVGFSSTVSWAAENFW
ncbi:hypothetical protein BASA60_003179 [Batrachochytrium salamandrivorans]|nr:hypothetical protein BASA60_003179 [Batrachochytrium salamandrivorans]